MTRMDVDWNSVFQVLMLYLQISPCRTLLWFFIALKEHQFLGEGSIFSELKRQQYSRDKALLKDDPRFFWLNVRYHSLLSLLNGCNKGIERAEYFFPCPRSKKLLAGVHYAKSFTWGSKELKGFFRFKSVWLRRKVLFFRLYLAIFRGRNKFRLQLTPFGPRLSVVITNHSVKLRIN